MIFSALKEFKKEVYKSIDDIAAYFSVELNATLRELRTGLYRLSFDDNFQSFTEVLDFEAGEEKAIYTEDDYKKQLKKVADTQAVIDSVVGYITSVNYKDFPDVVNMMDDAVDQLNKIKDAKAKHEDAAKKKDWNQATLWAEQVWQYQVKAADLGLRAKTYLEQNGAKKVK